MLLTGNYDYVQNQITWDTNGVQTMPASLYYTNQPAWFTNTWPPVNPLAPSVGLIPAMFITSGTNSGVASVPFNVMTVGGMSGKNLLKLK